MKMKVILIGIIVVCWLTDGMSQESKRTAVKHSSGMRPPEKSGPQQVSANGRIAISKSTKTTPLDSGKAKTKIASDGRSSVTTHEK